MSGDTLASLGEKITDVFVKTFSSANPSSSLVFLPFALSPPQDIVQPKSATDATPVVNSAQMAAFLAANFDEPYLVSAEECAVHGKDGYYGRLSQIYPLAVTLAQPTATAGSSGWRVLTAELAMAQSVLTPAGMAYAMACAPDDWVLPGNASYWSKFDSAQAQAAPPMPAIVAGAPASPTPARALWAFKAAEAQAAPAATLQYLHAVSPPQPAPATPAARIAPIVAREALIARPTVAPPVAAPMPAHRPVITSEIDRSEILVPMHPQPGVSPIPRRIPIDIPPSQLHPPPPPPPPPPAPPPPPPPPTSSMSMHFEYMSVGIGYMNAGISMWNGVFVANPDWCVPGMTRGGLLPSPAIAVADGHPPLAYGLPIALIVVRNLNVSVKWSGQDQAALGASGGYIGPFSLAGAEVANAPDGWWSYSQPGMQVIALLCTRMPVLPPKDAPDAAQPVAMASAGAGPASGSGGSPPASGAGASPPPSSGSGANVASSASSAPTASSG